MGKIRKRISGMDQKKRQIKKATHKNLLHFPPPSMFEGLRKKETKQAKRERRHAEGIKKGKA